MFRGSSGFLVLWLVLLSLSGWAQAVHNVPGDFASIQDAIDAASPGDIIEIAPGVYNEDLNVNKSISLLGAGQGVVTIDLTGTTGHNNSGIYVCANNVHLSGFLLAGVPTSTAPRYGLKVGEYSGGSLADITVQGMYRSGFDLLGASNMALTNITSQNNKGHGIALTDCNSITVTNLTTAGNGWQSVSVVTWGRYSPLGTSGIVFEGSLNLEKVFQLEQGQWPSGPPERITFSTDIADGADVTVPAGVFSVALFGDDDESPAYQRVYFFDSLATAMSAAAFPAKLGHLETTGRYLKSIVDLSQLYVSPGCSLQAALDGASAGNAVNVLAGSYTEKVDGSAGEHVAFLGDGTGTGVWEAPPSSWAFEANFSGSTATTTYEFAGLTMEGGVSGGLIKIVRASSGELYLQVHDNHFIENLGPGQWINSLWLCHNRGASRDPVTGLGPVRIYDNLDETVGGIAMSNSRAFDIFSNTFNGGSDALFIAYGCPTNTTIGDHYIYLNDFVNQAGPEPSIYVAYWGSGTGMTFLPNIVTLNSFNDSDNAVGYWMESTIAYPADLFSLNSFDNIAELGFEVSGPAALPVEATLNWWASETGPTHTSNPGGTGVAVSDQVIYSPWLGEDPDGDPATPGVQLGTPLVIIVDDIGPTPTETSIEVPAGLGLPFSGTIVLPAGYLNRAIGAANLIPGTDTIEVRHGSYDASEPITDGVTIKSEVGSTENTFLDGDLLIDAVNVLIGQMRQGFTLNGPITVGAGIDASTVHINWNDIFSVITNNGNKALDATFNYWGAGSDTVGRVRIHPYLPVPAAEVLGYMDDYGFNVMQAITFARLLAEGRPAGWAETATRLVSLFGMDPDDAMALIREYGLGRVKQALRFADDLEEFLVKLLGYVASGGRGGFFLGGGAGAATGMSSFCVGCSVPLQLELVHPITGEVIDDALVSYSVCRTLEDGTCEIVAFGVMAYDGDLGAYVHDLDTTGFEPGIYDIYLGTDDGRSQLFQIEVAVY